MMRVRVSRCERACVLVYWNLTFQPSVFFAVICGNAAAAPFRLYHTVPQLLKIPTLWEPRYNGSRTACLCEPLLTCYACVD